MRLFLRWRRTLGILQVLVTDYRERSYLASRSLALEKAAMRHRRSPVN